MSNIKGVQPASTHEFVQNTVDTFFKLSKLLSPFSCVLVFLYVSFQVENLIIRLFWTFVIGSFLSLAVRRFIYKPLRTMKFNECLQKMNGDMAALAFNPSKQFQTQEPVPSLIAVDRDNRKLYLQNVYTDYKGLILDASQILNVKVEREISMETRTTYDSSSSSPGLLGDTHHSGGKSHSSTEITEDAFLEIHYEESKGGSPVFSVIPFGTYRRTADSMLVAIEQIRGD